MPKAPKHGYYAVRIGRTPGIYLSWADCEAQVKGFPGALYKKLSTEDEAGEFMAAKPSTPTHTRTLTMPKAPKHGYYAVRTGRAPGIYLSWADCEAQVKGFPGALYKKLNTEAEAGEFMAAKPSTPTPVSHDIIPVASTSGAVLPEPKLPTRTVAIHATAEDEEDCDIVYCDGACKGNGQADSVAGIGVWWGHGDPRNISERCPGDQTNNRAELIAIVRILETTPRLKRRLLIKSDSKYSIRCVSTWIFNWMGNEFRTADKKPVKNCALIKYLAALLHARRKTSQTVEFKHVRGHVGIEGNEAADQLANIGVTKPAVPERDWENLERQVLQNLEPVRPIEVVDDDPEIQAYADGLLSDAELAELLDLSTDDVTLPVQPVLGAGARQGETTTVRSRSKPTTTINKEELEIYASGLLGHDELSALGKDGVFDSDF